MDVVNTIVKSLNGYIFNLSEKISEEYNIPLEDILKVWCEQNNICFQSVFAPMIKISKKQKKITTSSSNITTPSSTVIDTIEEEDEEISNLCSYIFTRGPKKDQRCTIVAKTGTLCSKHKK